MNYLILLKKSKTKLVLNADSTVELDGWHKTLDSVIKGSEKISHLGGNETTPATKYRYENVELNSSPERGREVIKSKGKVPIPTPRNITPSRDAQTKDVTEMKDEDKQGKAIRRLDDVVKSESNEYITKLSDGNSTENQVRV